MTKTELLLPQDNIAYLQASVNADFGVASRPDGFADKTPNQLADPAALGHHLSPLASSRAEGFILTSKNVPHGVREVMWMDAAHPYRSTMGQLSDKTAHGLFYEAATFFDVGESQGLYPSISWSHDPATSHRVSIQGEKRLHLHGIVRSAEDVERAHASRTTLGQLDPIPRRRLMDEFAIVGKSIVDGLAVKYGLATNDIHPGLLSLDIGSSESLRDIELTTKLISFFRQLEILYDSVIAELGGENKYGILNQFGPRLVTADRLPNLSSKSVARLSQFMSGLRPIKECTVERIAFSRYKHFAKTVIPLSGLAYSVTIAPVASRLAAHIRFCKFSDMGGAGCAVIEGVPTRIVRGRGTMSEVDMYARSEFQETIAKAISK